MIIFYKALDFLTEHYWAARGWLSKKGTVVKMHLFTSKGADKRRKRRALPLRKRHDIIGLLLLLTVVSIAYSSIAVWFNISTVGIVPKLMLLPQIVAGAGVVMWKFTK